jgi:hypothetical protein
MAALARRRFLQVYPATRGLPPQRLAARRVPPGEPPSLLFTFLGAIVTGDGQLEERLLAVRLGLDGEPVADGPNDLSLVADGSPPGEVPASLLEALASSGFPSLAARATELAAATLAREAANLRERRATQAATLRAELDADLADRLAELEEEERHARGLVDDGRQLRLFALDESAGSVYRAQRAALETHRQRRLEELDRFAAVPEPPPGP